MQLSSGGHTLLRMQGLGVATSSQLSWRSLLCVSSLCSALPPQSFLTRNTLSGPISPSGGTHLSPSDPGATGRSEGFRHLSSGFLCLKFSVSHFSTRAWDHIEASASFTTFWFSVIKVYLGFLMIYRTMAL